MTRLEPLVPTDEEQFAQFHTVYASAYAETWDRPYSARERRAELMHESAYTRTHAIVAREDSGQAVGMGVIELPQKDNLELAYIEVAVAPSHRRRGHGSAILDELARIAAEHRRRNLLAEARWDVDRDGSPHTAFAEARGFRLDLADAHRVLSLPATLPPAPARDGYRLRSWRGSCPEQWAEQYATLLALLVQEAPSGDFALENEYFDTERVRSDERLLAAMGRQMQVVVALAPDGSLVGHTQLVFPEDPEDVFQWDTLVLPDHRGHGLGLSLKVAAMQESQDLLEGRRHVHTYNAGVNAPMIAVNEALGFRQVAWLGEFVRDT